MEAIARYILGTFYLECGEWTTPGVGEKETTVVAVRNGQISSQGSAGTRAFIEGQRTVTRKRLERGKNSQQETGTGAQGVFQLPLPGTHRIE